MKLLLVEDEEMTREGLIQSLPWEEIGITEIIQEKDGAAGLKKAKKEHPAIILCDIRMPKMDGLTMLERVHAVYPETVFVLLTGHAEIDYLKRAITLNVVSFIEKPINIPDLTDALKKSVERVISYNRQQESAQIHSTVVASRLAYQMTFPYESCKPVIDSLYKDFLDHYGTDKFRYVTTIIVLPEHFSNDSTLLYTIGQKLHDRLLPGHYHIIYTDRSPRDIIYQIYGSIEPSCGTLKMIGDIILSYYKSHTRCFVSVGSVVKGIQNAWHSCETARERLRYARFYEADTVLTDPPREGEMTGLPSETRSGFTETEKINQRISELPRSFRTALEDGDEEQAISLLEEFRRMWYHSKCRESMIKSSCYSMLITINQMYQASHINADAAMEHPGMIIDAIDSAFTFLEVDELLHKRTREFFYHLSHNKEEDNTIYRIKEYINSHYKDPALSVKSISESVFLSVSYLCTYFKNETRTTLNQYITDYRIKKAQHLLSDTNMKIVDVAGEVGYRDSNYFAKIFKKQTGLSPKEYKNKNVR